MKSQLLIASLSLVFLFSCQHEKPGKISFNEHIRPIFNQKCLSCHGGVKKLGKFSMLFEEEAFQTTDSGKPAIVRGNYKKSELYQRIVHANPEMRMPLDAPPLTEKEVELIAQWIEEGAKWEMHWAFCHQIVLHRFPNWMRIGPHTIVSLMIYEQLRAWSGLRPV